MSGTASFALSLWNNVTVLLTQHPSGIFSSIKLTLSTCRHLESNSSVTLASRGLMMHQSLSYSSEQHHVTVRMAPLASVFYVTGVLWGKGSS